MDRWNVVYLYKGILLGNKKESASDEHNNTEESQNNYAKCKDSDKGSLLENSTYQKK